jgi:hypothetical protein
MRRHLVLLVFFVSAVARIDGHHSLTEYDSSRSMTLTATVREFHFVNPHPYLIVDARFGPFVNEWRLELDNRFELVEIGMTAETFKRGDEVLVTGPPGRDQKPILYVRALDRPADGFRYEQPDSTPRIVRPSRGGR